MAIGLGRVLLLSSAMLFAHVTLAKADDPIAYEVFGAVKGAALSDAPASIGSFSKGCLIGGEQLAKDGPGWSAMRLERGRRWGHPRLISFIERLSKRAQQSGMDGILVGDLGQVRGGPMKGGHRSHQTGLDVDIWLRPMGERRPTAQERSSQSSYDLVQGRSTLKTALWNKSAAPLIQMAAEDVDVTRIFVNPVIKRQLCEETKGKDRSWLNKVRAWWGHDAHFHVRLSCPIGDLDCIEQDPPPAGHGCESEELAWWFTDEPYSGTSSPREPILMSDLPEQCAAVAEMP